MGWTWDDSAFCSNALNRFSMTSKSSDRCRRLGAYSRRRVPGDNGSTPAGREREGLTKPGSGCYRFLTDVSREGLLRPEGILFWKCRESEAKLSETRLSGSSWTSGWRTFWLTRQKSAAGIWRVSSIDPTYLGPNPESSGVVSIASFTKPS